MKQEKSKTEKRKKIRTELTLTIVGEESEITFRRTVFEFV